MKAYYSVMVVFFYHATSLFQHLNQYVVSSMKRLYRADILNTFVVEAVVAIHGIA